MRNVSSGAPVFDSAASARRLMGALQLSETDVTHAGARVGTIEYLMVTAQETPTS